MIRKNKDTTKIRIVYDASAKSEGPSLNQCLHTGPKFHQQITDLLLRFRVFPVVVVADIEKVFLMIQVAEENRDALHFLWVKDLAAEQPEIIKLRFARVIFGVSSSPFLLNVTFRHYLEHAQADPETVNKLLKAFYVDDIVTGASNEDEAHGLYHTAQMLLKKGGFHLRKFTSNPLILRSAIDREENAHLQPATLPTRPSDMDETCQYHARI